VCPQPQGWHPGALMVTGRKGIQRVGSLCKPSPLAANSLAGIETRRLPWDGLEVPGFVGGEGALLILLVLAAPIDLEAVGLVGLVCHNHFSGRVSSAKDEGFSREYHRCGVA